jgi:hypothetical protein
MEPSFENFLRDTGSDSLSRGNHLRRICFGRTPSSDLSAMASRVPLGQVSGTEDELARISQQGYSFSNHQSYRPEEEYFLDDFGQ